jgi:hypothetical protein
LMYPGAPFRTLNGSGPPVEYTRAGVWWGLMP